MRAGRKGVTEKGLKIRTVKRKIEKSPSMRGWSKPDTDHQNTTGEARPFDSESGLKVVPPAAEKGTRAMATNT